MSKMHDTLPPDSSPLVK